MKHEKSCGAIVYQYVNEQLLFLLIKHQNGGHWAFTKGHVENEESEEETAQREIREEVNLEVIIDNRFRISTSYSPSQDIIKEVVYFIAQAQGHSIKTQIEEVSQFSWLNFKEAHERLSYANDQQILTEAYHYLTGK